LAGSGPGPVDVGGQPPGRRVRVAVAAACSPGSSTPSSPRVGQPGAAPPATALAPVSTICPLAGAALPVIGVGGRERSPARSRVVPGVGAHQRYLRWLRRTHAGAARRAGPGMALGPGLRGAPAFCGVHGRDPQAHSRRSFCRSAPCDQSPGLPPPTSPRRPVCPCCTPQPVGFGATLAGAALGRRRLTGRRRGGACWASRAVMIRMTAPLGGDDRVGLSLRTQVALVEALPPRDGGLDGLDGLPGCARRSQRWALQVGFPHIWQPAGESALVVEWRCRRCGALAVGRLEEGEPEAG